MADKFLVQDFMTAPPVTIPHTARLLDAALMLRSSSIRHLPIVDGKRLLGIITDRDVQRCAPSRLVPITENEYNAIFENTPLARVMTRNPQTISPHAPLAEAAELLHNQMFGCLPVVDEGCLVGIITRSDLIGALCRLLTHGFENPDPSVRR